MRAGTRLLVLTGALVGACRDRPVIVDGGNEAPRLISPLSTATVTSRQPMLSWALPSGADGAHVQICRDRACATEIASFDATGTEVAAPDLPAGVVFWRAAARRGDDVATTFSPTWQFTVGARSARAEAGEVYFYLGGAEGLSGTPTAVLNGPEPRGHFGGSVASAGDVNGDGYADVIVGAPDVDSSAGRAMVHLGGAEGLSATPDVVLTGPDGPFGLFGVSVAGAGDVNGAPGRDSRRCLSAFPSFSPAAPSALPTPCAGATPPT